jgi:hypothetical protein
MSQGGRPDQKGVEAEERRCHRSAKWAIHHGGDLLAILIAIEIDHLHPTAGRADDLHIAWLDR